MNKSKTQDQSDSRLKEVALKLAQVDESKVVLKKQVDLLTRKLKQKVADCDNADVELKSERSNRVRLDEDVHSLQLELRSVQVSLVDNHINAAANNS